MLEKIIPVGSWPRMSEQCVQIMKVSSRGLTSGDRFDFLEKRAGAHEFIDALESGQIKLAKGEIPVHALAVGATERFGANRNGDAWNIDTCRKQHHTFKQAKHFLHHKNKSEKGDPHYGVVKASAFNEPMGRIEILFTVNGTKEAADSNHGLVLPDHLLAKIEKGEDYPGSMACKVAFDKCAICGNEAANRSEYCTEDTCLGEHGERGFGCKHGLTKVCADGRQQYVENPGADFFDWSGVIRPADRNAYGWKADYLTKSAEVGHVIGGAELAELWALENGYAPPAFAKSAAHDTTRRALLYKLAAIEQQLETNPALRQRAIACAFSSSLQPPMDLGPLGAPGSRKLASALKELAGQKIAMPFRDFVRLFVQDDAVKTAAVVQGVLQRLPGVFSRLALDNDLDYKLAANPYVPAAELAPATQRRWAEKSAQRYSLADGCVQGRVVRSALRSLPVPGFRDPGHVKEASAEGEEIAREYGLYKFAMLETLAQEPDFARLCEMAVIQNYVQD